MPKVSKKCNLHFLRSSWSCYQSGFVQVDKTVDPQKVRAKAESKGIVCMSALNGDGLQEFCDAVQRKLKVWKAIIPTAYWTCSFWSSTLKTFSWQDYMVWVEALVPYDKGELLNTIHQVGMVQEMVSTLNLLFFKIWD